MRDAQHAAFSLPGEADQARRKRAKSFLPRSEAIASVKPTLEAMQKELLERARAFREKRTRVIDTMTDFEKFFKDEGGGFAWVHWAGEAAQEDEMAKRYETSIPCAPLNRLEHITQHRETKRRQSTLSYG